MTETNQDIGPVFAGDSLEITIDVVEDGSAKDLSGSSVEWAASERPGGAEVLDESAPGVTVSITDASNGEVTVTIESAVTDVITGKLFHELRVTDSSGRKSVVTRGTVTILSRVNR